MSIKQTAAASPALVGQLVVWIFAVLVSIAAAVFGPEGMRFTWLGIGLGASIILAFVWELGTHTKEGFVARVAILSSGAFVIFVIVAAISGFIVALAP
ncbi:hypothetical protein [Paramicrobacterium humi]|uniref:hypothetical protein n=1 Tax=Paramicrobacterium humi TaxID=640635 RepID=UPI00116004FB|nr:hypothetical protein [Microbacterium humi]